VSIRLGPDRRLNEGAIGPIEAEDFGEAFTPELRAQEERLRAQAARQQQS
jgi:hypothetical protein